MINGIIHKLLGEKSPPRRTLCVRGVKMRARTAKLIWANELQGLPADFALLNSSDNFLLSTSVGGTNLQQPFWVEFFPSIVVFKSPNFC